MKKRIMLRVCSALFLAALLIEVSFLPRDLWAQAPFYQGKTISLIMGTAPGGSSDMMVKSPSPI
jgi:tripartite-type tricarboxylate transporter receptor subunit TctC